MIVMSIHVFEKPKICNCVMDDIEDYVSGIEGYWTIWSWMELCHHILMISC